MIIQTIYLVLDNIRSAHNVGSIFRTADAAGVSKIYLCGYTPLPQPITTNSQPTTFPKYKPTYDKISKTALGAEHTVPWEHHQQTWRLIKKLKRNQIQVIALEQAEGAISLFDFKPVWPLALIVGNEVTGISQSILKRVEKIVTIPQYGHKESLNVSIAVGIALYSIIHHGQSSH